jgi:sarcinarray family protein
MRFRMMLLGFGLLCMVLLRSPLSSAGECSYGVVHAWLCDAEDGWVNATAHPSFHPGQKFNITVEVRTIASLQVFYVKLHEFGTPVYEVCDGPSSMEQLLANRACGVANQTFVYRWTLRVLPGTGWVDGVAPLEVFVQFNRDDEKVCWVDFDVLTAYILPPFDVERNETYPPLPLHSDASSHDAPSGFDALGTLMTVLSVAVLWKQKKT